LTKVLECRDDASFALNNDVETPRNNLEDPNSSPIRLRERSSCTCGYDLSLSKYSAPRCCRTGDSLGAMNGSSEASLHWGKTPPCRSAAKVLLLGCTVPLT